MMMGTVIGYKGSVYGSVAMTINRLGDSYSPYLAQHAENPIHWYPWSESAFEDAKSQNKPIFLSIGYSTCYWCHFMEKDSFEMQDVADILNRHFISIKVDREEHPDVDQLYMNALIAFRGRGGWPISVILTPEGVPFFAESTIFHDPFIKILTNVASRWQDPEFQKQARDSSILSALDQMNQLPVGPDDIDFERVLSTFIDQVSHAFDDQDQGFGSQTKFPMPHLFRSMLMVHQQRPDSGLLEKVTGTLDRMATSGLFDMVEGGFHRYSVDPAWKIPHFEKMLYDNLGLVWLYLEAYQVTESPLYSYVSRATLDFLLSTFYRSGQGFYTALDAGEVDREGEYYVFDHEDLKQRLSSEEFAYLETHFNLSADGNFEHGATLLQQGPEGTFCYDSAMFKQVQAQLQAIRSTRTRPHMDTKQLLSWNGLSLGVLAKAFEVLGDERYLIHAQSLAQYLLDHAYQEGRLVHEIVDGHAFGRAILDDYAFLIHGLLRLYEADFNPSWLDWALQLQVQQDQLFGDDGSGGYFLSDGQDPNLLIRQKSYVEGAVLSGNAVAMLNQLHFSSLMLDSDRWDQVTGQLKGLSGALSQHPYQYADSLWALVYQKAPSYEVAMITGVQEGDQCSILKALRQTYFPNKVLSLGNESSQIPLLVGKVPIEDQFSVYVCERGTCYSPVRDVQSLTDTLGL
ncbi:MAG: hypothetical protein CL521_00360 [Actinobacteria bacterium]|nr:hypothetical protein [Actinomycetota bacterium]